MPIVACPACQTRLKVPDQAAGKKVKCPKCSATIDVPAETEAAPACTSDRFHARVGEGRGGRCYRRQGAADTAPPKKSRKMLYIGLGVGVVLLLSCCCLGIGGGIASYFIFLSGEKNEKVNAETFSKLKVDTTLPDLEKELGPAKPTTPEDVRAAYKNKSKAEQDKLVEEHKAMIDKDANYRWRNGDDVIFAIFKGPEKQGGKVGQLLYVRPLPGGVATSSTGFWPK